MALQLTGKIIEIFDVHQITERFKKQEFILDITETNGETTYENYARLQVVQNKCDLLNNYNLGDTVIASFNVRGNKWEKDGRTNYINSLDVWRIELVSKSTDAGTKTVTVQQGYSQGFDETLPF